MSEALNDEQRKTIYLTMLKGLADEAQDRLCAADTQHVWSRWDRRALKPDWPLAPVYDGMCVNETVKVSATRRCRNCGKEQHA